MTNREFYQKTFSHLHSAAEVRWEDCEKRSRRKKSVKGRIFLLAAVIALLTLPTAAAVAVNFMGLRDVLMPAKGIINVTDPATGVVVPGQTQQVDVISLSGYMDTPESQALAEWQAFLDSYDQDGSILQSVGNTLDPDLFAKYGCYWVYTQEMGDKLDAIAAKYGLKLHTDVIDLYAHPEALGSLSEFGKDQKTYWTYMYEDGTCHFDGYTDVPDFGLVDVQFQRAVKGRFNEVTLNIRNVDEYVSWNYQTADGSQVLLALGPGMSLVLADFEDCFAVFNVFVGADGGMTREYLEALADCYDFTLLTPVVPPDISVEEPSDTGVTADTAQQAYANALWELWGSGVFPDGTPAETTGDGQENLFSIYDVDGDGSEELLILYTSASMSGQIAYVLDYDDSDSPLRVELCEFPALTFYSGGFVRADWSHNQGLAGDALWPYTLYRYNSQTDSYEPIADVDAWEKQSHPTDDQGTPFPDEADTSGTGAVYYVRPSGTYGVIDPMDGQAYQDWWRGEVGDAAELPISYQTLTRENIAALSTKPLPESTFTFPAG